MHNRIFFRKWLMPNKLPVNFSLRNKKWTQENLLKRKMCRKHRWLNNRKKHSKQNPAQSLRLMMDGDLKSLKKFWIKFHRPMKDGDLKSLKNLKQ